jgi:uncharacterized YigZ family protein
LESNSFFLAKTKAEGLFKDKGSKFFGYIFPVKTEEEIKQHLQDLKKEHFSARHFCYAYRIGTVNIKFRANDDGEPSNSAGKPILGQIQSHNLTNCLIVVVRYFGGTLLGVSGLINAYKNGAIEAINNAQLIEHHVENYYLVKFGFTQINEVMRVLKNHNARIISQNTITGYELSIAILTNKTEETLTNLNKLLNLDIELLYSE